MKYTKEQRLDIGRRINAAEAWKQDLRLDNTYSLIDQRTIWIKSVKHMYEAIQYY